MSLRTLSIVGIPLTVLACMAIVSPARAECEPGWWPCGGLSGLDGAPGAMVAWDPDGDGPQVELLIVGGSFTHAGDIEVNGIAAWDGERWQALGSGVRLLNESQYGRPGVGALAVHNGELYVSGYFEIAGDVAAASVARWDGTSWQAVGTGLRADDSEPGRANVLLRYGGELIAAGEFRYAGEVAAQNIARWDGRMWRPLGPGVDGRVVGLTIHEGALVAAGSFSMAGGLATGGVASWDGATWQSLRSPQSPYGDGLSYSFHDVTAILSHDGVLYAGIKNTSRDYSAVWYYASAHVARWTGTDWQRVDVESAGYSCYKGPPVVQPRVSTLGVYDGEVYVGGSDVSLCRWDGSRWDGVGGPGDVSSMSVYRGELIVGGPFDTVGDVAADNIARWDHTTWRALGHALDAAVNALASFKGELIAGGDFVRAGNVDVNHVARWDGTSWQALGGGLDGPVYALTVYGGELIAGGEFTLAGDAEARSIARWDGSAWSPLGSGVYGRVRAFAEHEGLLIVGGHFSLAGDLDAHNIARWDGSTWGPLQLGLRGGGVNALAVYRGELIAAGRFTYAYNATVTEDGRADEEAIKARYLARWDGASWHAFEKTVQTGAEWDDESCVAPCLYALAVHNDELVIGGNFKYVGGIRAFGVARWDGSEWHKLGRGFEHGTERPVRALTLYKGELIAGGQLWDVDNLARWDGTQWQALGLGGDYADEVRALTIHHCDLIVGGEFKRTGANASAYWARWGSPCDASCPEADVDADAGDDPNAEQDAPPAPACPLAAGTLVTLTVAGLVRSRRATPSHRPR